MSSIDTSISGFEYVGIKLTKEQHEELCELNMLILSDKGRQNIPVFNTMLVLKILGLIPPEMISDVRNNNSYDNSDENINQSLQCKFGKIID